MKTFFVSLVSIAALALYVRYLENRTVFAPSKTLDATPQDIGLFFENIFLKTADGLSLHGWFIPAQNALAKTTLLYLHGNAGNISGRLSKIKIFHDLGLDVFIIDYRGYGRSEGVATEIGVYLDAMAAYDYLQTRLDLNRNGIIAYGASLGGAVAVDLATKRKINALIIDSSFTNAKDMAKTIFPFVPSFFIKTKLDAVSKIKNLTIPKLFIHSVEDDLVPIALGEKLYQASLKPKVFLKIKGTHNDGHEVDRDNFVNGIKQFLIAYHLL